ncbi:MAG TPA: hypothetical protein VMT02_04415 [Burkholderiales bacterium]|nr:hypothetical protein [Burkholderiales bacterium]
MALAALEPLLEANVAKEIRKDAQAIACAAELAAAGRAPREEDLGRLLDRAREVDREFLAGMRGLPVQLDIPYARIEPLRRKRVERGLDLALRILDGWRAGRGLRALMPADALERRLRELLALYCEETTALAAGVRASGAIAALRGRAAQLLGEVMNAEAERLAHEAARAVHRVRFASHKST